MKQVTRNIDPESASDLLERVPRACISFACEQGPQAQPVSLIWRDKRYFVGIPTQATYKPNAEQEVVLLVDEGIHYYDLRGSTFAGQCNLLSLRAARLIITSGLRLYRPK